MKKITFMLLAGKRALKNPLYVLMLVFLCFSVLFFGSIEKEITLPESGFTLLDNDPEALILRDKLIADGYKLYESESEMKEAIRAKDITIGFSVQPGLTERLRNGDLDGVLTVYSLPTAAFVNVTALRVISHVTDIYAPYLTERMMQEQGITLTQQQVREYMDQHYAEDAQFMFQFQDVDGKILPPVSYSRQLIYGMFAILLFCLFALCTSTEKDSAYRNLHDRVGCKQAFLTVLLPSYAVKYAFSLCTVALSATVCRLLCSTDVRMLALRCAVYMLYLCGVGALLYAVLYKFSRVQLYVLTFSLLSLGVCPIFFDLSAYAKIPEVAKLLLPPYFFYIIPKSPLFAVLLAVAVCASGFWLLYQREKRLLPKTRI